VKRSQGGRGLIVFSRSWPDGLVFWLHKVEKGLLASEKVTAFTKKATTGND